MSGHASSTQPKRILIGIVCLFILIGLWYAFRPEKLFVNKRVNEAAPAEAGSLTPLFTGRFVGEVHKTSGRATVYLQPDGNRVLRLTDFSTSNGPALHLLLIDGSSTDATKDFSITAIRNVDLGDLKGNQGDQDYSLPRDIDLKIMNTVSVYCERFHANFGIAALQEL